MAAVKQMPLPGLGGVYKVSYYQTKGAKGVCWVLIDTNNKENHLTKHADGNVNAHGEFEQIPKGKRAELFKELF